ncbi:MAG: DUF6524 family protein [Pseudomonadota bacterium]
MAVYRITWQGVLIRFVIALILVFATYNPHGLSYFDWLEEYFNPAKENSTPLALIVFAGIILLIGWTIFIRATIRSLGMFGLILAFGFFGTLLWLAISYDVVSVDNVPLLTDLVLIVFSGVLATGMSWSHIRRRMSGQLDVDDVDPS